jgi:membrane-bound inhibitor of C-type lysozyme
VQGQPRCLVLEPGSGDRRSAKLGVCEFEAIGTQAWWVKGHIVEPLKGGFEMGSDGAGKLNCLEINERRAPQLEPCPEGDRLAAWRFEPVNAPTADPPRATPPPVTAGGARPAAPAATPADGLYVCENGSEVTVVQQDPAGEEIRVRYKNQWQTMRPAISASGARYVGKTLEWWSKGMVEGSLFRHQKDGSTGDLVATCSRPKPEPAAD